MQSPCDRNATAVSVLERIRRFWMPGPGPDHPLTEQEREGVPPTAVDEAARLVEGFVGGSFDADAREQSRAVGGV